MTIGAQEAEDLNEYRYTLYKDGSGALILTDHLNPTDTPASVYDIEVIELKRSDLEDLKRLVDMVLSKP